MRVLLLTQLFDPENVIKGLSFAKGLVSRGHEVEVVTTFPSYPGGRIYPGYKMRWRQVENIDGVRVVRVFSYISHGRSAFKRLMSYASFSSFALLYSLFGAKRPDVIYSYYPPVVGGSAAAILGFVQRRPMIYDVQDLWPEALVATGMVQSPRLIGVIEAMVTWIYRRAAAVVVLSDGYKSSIERKGIPAKKVFRIYNWCDESRLVRKTPAARSAGEWFNITYAGNLGSAQALDHVLEAAALVQERADNKVRFVFVGEGVEKTQLQNNARTLGLKNVLFVPQVAPEKVGALLDASGALLTHLAADPVFSITVPSKTQAYLAAGRPILMGVDGESADIIGRAGAGVVVSPCDPADIARGALELANKSSVELAALGEAARRFYENQMSQNNGIDRIVEVLNLVVADSKY